MNERIQKLAEDADAYADAMDIGGKNYIGLRDEYFAELIVRECASAFEAEVDTWKQMDPYQGSIKRQGTNAIKKHFGVK